MRLAFSTLAVAILAVSWLGPLPALARDSFAAHMTLHITVVAVAAPLFAIAMTGTIADPVRAMPRLVAAIPASMIELITVWAWHVPVLHHAARVQSAAFVLEQGTFLASGWLLWIAAIGGDREQRRLRAGGGIAALLFTSMHMTLLGALFTLGNRPLFTHTTANQLGASVSVAQDLRPGHVADQQLGGVIMLFVGGASYLIGGLCLTALALRSTPARSMARQEPMA
jgi:putative membrane protein